MEQTIGFASAFFEGICLSKNIIPDNTGFVNICCAINIYLFLYIKIDSMCYKKLLQFYVGVLWLLGLLVFPLISGSHIWGNARESFYRCNLG